MYQVYVAFSIHGTNTFIVATKEVNDRVIFDLRHHPIYEDEWKIVQSRRPNVDPKQVKLQWSGLMNQKTKQPLRSAPMVLRRFKQLEVCGWKVDEISRERFIDKHWGRDRYAQANRRAARQSGMS